MEEKILIEKEKIKKILDIIKNVKMEIIKQESELDKLINNENN